MKQLLTLFILSTMMLAACEEPLPLPDVIPNVVQNISGDISDKSIPDKDLTEEIDLAKFDSCKDLSKVLEEAKPEWDERFVVYKKHMMADSSAPAPMAKAAGGETQNLQYSETNIQVAGVDEADIIKTDGNYIYALAKNTLYIIKSYPAEKATLLSKFSIENFNPMQLYLKGDRVLLIGNSWEERYEEPMPVGKRMVAPGYYPYGSTTTIKLLDTSNKEDPKVLRTVEFKGDYLSSRRIGGDSYIVLKNYFHYWDDFRVEEAIPRIKIADDYEPVAGCTEISYIPPARPESFVTLLSISMDDETKEIEKETILGAGNEIFSSMNNLYIAQQQWNGGWYDDRAEERTILQKFNLEQGHIKYQTKGEVPGRILNQFSMDEYDGHFRIAMTVGNVHRVNTGDLSSNNVYVLDKNMEIVGKVEDLAPGEKIYSVRFMGEKGYVVTFKKVDPLFVIDLKDHNNPKVLGKLKIPGYSDYLHPYDENHIIGIGKNTVEAEEGDFAWYQGLKLAIFDVTDVENPIELHKEIIGDRGTDSPALHDHKAFLFDKSKNLLVFPVTVAEIKGEKSRDNQYGDYVFQGAYVYDLSLEDGFQLQGKVSHYDNDEIYKKAGYYFSGDASIKRSLYIEDVLYTLSDARLQMNSLDSLEKIRAIPFD